MTSNSGHWSFESGISTSYDSNGITTSANDWSGMITDCNIPTPFELEYYVVNGSSYDNRFGFIGIWLTDESNNPFQYSNVGNTVRFDVTGMSNVNLSSYVGQYNLKVFSNKFELYKDDSLIATYSRTNESAFKVKFTSGKNATFKFKNVKIKPL